MSVTHPLAAEHHHPELDFIRKYIFSTDHKIIGIQFLFTSIIFLGVGGILALLVRIQLAWPHAEIPFMRNWFLDNGGRMPETFYNMLFSMHASVMIFFVIIPFLTGAFGNFTIPLMIGAKDMAFPALNMMSYWFMWPAFLCFGSSFFVSGGGPAAGWTVYAPLSVNQAAAPGSGPAQTLWLIGLTFVGVSSMMGS